MLLWIVLTTLTSIVAVCLAAPFLAERGTRTSADSVGLQVYRDQLAEVDRESRDGLIDADQAELARLEIKRGMLGAERTSPTMARALSLAERHGSVAMIVGLVALGSTILYANMGRPDVPSAAHAPTELVLDQEAQAYAFRARGAKPGGAQAPGPVQAQSTATSAPAVVAPVLPLGTAAAGAPKAPIGTVDDMIERLLARLKKDPANVETLRMLGWSYAATGRVPEALDAYSKAVALAPQNAQMLTAYGELMVRSADGQVKPDAVAVFDRALAVEPKNVHARYFKARALEQAGDKQGALDLYIAAAGDAPLDDPTLTDIRDHAVALAATLGVDVTGRLPQAPASPPAALQAGAPKAAELRGPTAANVKAAEQMSDADRSAMIHSMVDGLAGRLEQSPRDADGWLRLIRARLVLGETDKAKAALAKAMLTFADAPDQQARIADGAREAGLAPP